MLAQLYYPAGASLISALNDMVAVLSGTTDISQLSAVLDKTESEVVADKKQADWELVGRMGMGAEPAPNNFANGRIGIAVLSRPCTSKPGASKFIQLKFGTISGVTARLTCSIGRGVAAGGDLSGPSFVNSNDYSGYDPFTQTHYTDIPVFSSQDKSTVPFRITVYGSDTAVLIALAVTDLMQPKFQAAFLEMENKWSEFSTSSANVPHILCHNARCVKAGNVDNGYRTTSIDIFVSAPMLIGGVSYGSGVTSSPGREATYCRFGFCTPEVSITNAMYRDADKKFSGFSDKGSKYDLYSFGSNANNRMQYNNSNTTNSPRATEMFPYSSITDVTGVYLINQNAFGRDGSYFNTPVGTMCKFGMFMVEVG